MKRFNRSDLRGGMTLYNSIWRWGYIHAPTDPQVEQGEFVLVGRFIYWVSQVHYLRYAGGDVMIVVSLWRFRWLELTALTFLLLTMQLLI